MASPFWDFVKTAIDKARGDSQVALPLDAGWSSLVARQAHNLKVAGSNPAPAPNFAPWIQSKGHFVERIAESRVLTWKKATSGNSGHPMPGFPRSDHA